MTVGVVSGLSSLLDAFNDDVSSESWRILCRRFAAMSFDCMLFLAKDRSVLIGGTKACTGLAAWPLARQSVIRSSDDRKRRTIVILIRAANYISTSSCSPYFFLIPPKLAELN